MAYSIDLAGRVAFVTGASGGLGAQFARVLARSGAAVVLAAIASIEGREAVSIAGMREDVAKQRQ